MAEWGTGGWQWHLTFIFLIDLNDQSAIGPVSNYDEQSDLQRFPFCEVDISPY